MKTAITVILALAIVCSGISFTISKLVVRNYLLESKEKTVSTVKNTSESPSAEEKRKIAYELGDLLKERAQLLPPKKWHELTVYETSNGGFIYYLGSNILNGLTFYWNGNLENQKIQALDDVSSDKLGGVKLYTGKDLEQIKQEWENSDTVKKYLSDF
jgi:hypothetical protein